MCRQLACRRAPWGRVSLGLVTLLFLLGAGSVGGAAWAQMPAESETAGSQVWSDPDGNPVRFSSLEDLKSFLQTAEVRKTKVLRVGITDPEKLLLEQDGRRLHAHFQSFDKMHRKVRLDDGRIEYRYRDSYKFNIAAFKLGLLLGLDNIPPSFSRRRLGEEGSITVWIEDVMSETTRTKDQHRPPQPLVWSRQMTRMRIFDELIANDDRNQGNILIDKDWKVWLIDHTRAFRPRNEMKSPTVIRGCERKLWSRLRTLSDDQIHEALREWLTEEELEALLARRRLLVEHIEGLIATHGEELVLYDLSTQGS